MSVSRDREGSGRGREGESPSTAGKETSRILEAVLQASRAVLGVIDREGRILEINDRGVEWFGLRSREELLGIPIYDLPPESLREKRHRMVRKVLDERGPAQFEGLKGDRMVVVSICPVLDDAGEVSRMAISVDDVSARVRAERSLTESEERFRRVFDEGPFGMAIFDTALGITRVNGKFCNLLGYNERDLLGASFVSFSPAEEAKMDSAQMATLVNGEVPVLRADKRYVTKTGANIWVHLTASVIRDGGGRPPYGLAIIDDITESRALREERERLIFQLQDALANVKTLRGLIPICAWCKKVRNDQGYWMRIEAYLQEHSDADFTHGACPECASRLFRKEMDAKE